LTRHAHARKRAFRRPLGDSSTVEQRTLTPSILVRIQVPQPNLIFRQFGALSRLGAGSGSGRFRKHVKGLAEGRHHFTVLPSAVRWHEVQQPAFFSRRLLRKQPLGVPGEVEKRDSFLQIDLSAFRRRSISRWQAILLLAPPVRPHLRDRRSFSCLGPLQRGASFSGIVNFWLLPAQITSWRLPPLATSQAIE
jgi:hypothetical protein